ncbi:biosynthetic arginine decarboxylase [candidate division CSSED10-310 bacterium]|uniref:Biosynthetic arginine decarboxylase n=1 Tax=candidate division CSSED10-310 bacterium TaxID=2855610 RepID=A0ABV6Z0A1_UNCC1
MTKRVVKNKEVSLQKRWGVKDATELYNIEEWGLGFFKISPQGNLIVCPQKEDAVGLDLLAFLEELQLRNIELPVLIRFTDILQQRLIELNECFHEAIVEYEYEGFYRGVYPIKVNQHRHVVEDILRFGQSYHYGLEAGSKPELLLAIALLTDKESLIICNGYKDHSFIELALSALKMGKNVILVIEKLSEIHDIVSISRKLDIKPLLGVRVKLSSRGFGKWESSGGDKSKFGLFVSEILDLVEILKAEEMVDCFQLLHFHLGSQITSIQPLSRALRESSRIFSELHKLGVPLKYFDVGGGLAVDYDGSKSRSHSSANYNILEYAANVVAAIAEECNDENIPHPHIISESGRSIVAHHSVLLVKVLGVSEFGKTKLSIEMNENSPDVVVRMMEAYSELSPANFQETYHDALDAKDEALSLFMHGYLSLNHRAQVENIFWAICKKIVTFIHKLDYVPDEFKGLERFLCDIYFCNFSVFQSVPDSWAVNHLFPIMPIHRLDEKPKRSGILVDITCDSDGKINQFIDRKKIKHTLELHELDDKKPYYLGVFLVGAYQEILGDLHNLFGDTNMVHVSILPDGNYLIDKTIIGETVSEVLDYVQYNKKELLALVRKQMEVSIQSNNLSISESARLLKSYEAGLESYTYLLD